MLKTELLDIIAHGENSGVEFKRDDIRPEQLAKEVVALANLDGGRILIGVEDDGSITGIQRKNLQEWVLNVFRDKVHPQLIPYYEEIAIDHDSSVAVITLSSGTSKPYALRHNGRQEIFVRMGDRSQPASREQQIDLLQSGGLLHVEAMPVSGTAITDIDLDRLSFYLKSIVQDPEVPRLDDTDAWIERLSGLGLMTRDNVGNTACSIAGLVCFGYNPKKHFRQAGVRVMAFDGTELDYKAALDTSVTGPLVARYRETEQGNREIADQGIIERISQVLHPFITEESGSVSDNMTRQKQWHYPWEAIREVVVNALVHRDWTRNNEVEIRCFDNRIEVQSPGRLYNSMTVEKMKAGQRAPRNQIISDLMKDYKYADSRGMGIRTRLIPLIRKHNDNEPVFDATEDYLKVVLYRKGAQ